MPNNKMAGNFFERVAALSGVMKIETSCLRQLSVEANGVGISVEGFHGEFVMGAGF
jgi:hypothetical protein